MTQVDVRKKILEANEAAAARLRVAFRASRTLVVNIISSPGSGKTTLLEGTIGRMKDRFRLGGLDGDIATERDAERLRKAGIPARQILTGGACHLDARQVASALDDEGERFAGLDILFIENVGNLICPTSYDLGEDFKVALLSVTEGDDKPFKYPSIFSKAQVTVITKTDLLPFVEFDLGTVRSELATLRPDGTVFEVSSKTGAGLDAWCTGLEERLSGKRTSPADLKT
jgi:hydrogenase nickel incorporation protein HypB